MDHGVIEPSALAYQLLLSPTMRNFTLNIHYPFIYLFNFSIHVKQFENFNMYPCEKQINQLGYSAYILFLLSLTFQFPVKILFFKVI